MAELKPCPFCGSKDIRKLTTLSKADIWCGSCYVGITRCVVGIRAECLADAEESFGADVTKAWNRRAEDGK